MKIVLLRSVPGLGQAGEVKEVADGFARNYLIPHSLVAPATAEWRRHMAAIAHCQRQAAETVHRDTARTLRLLAGKRLMVAATANVQGTLFAAVTSVELSAILKAEGFDVPAQAIQLQKPIKRIGQHHVIIDLGNQGHVACTVVVKSKL